MTGGRPAPRPSRRARRAVSPQVRRLLLAALGGERYRQRARAAIERDVRDAPPAELGRCLAFGHLAAPFFAAFGTLLPAGPLRDELAAAVRAQRLHASVLRTHFLQVGDALRALSAPPVVLKGAALWGWIYPDPALRRTRDLDLLVSHPDDLRRAVDALRALGFAGDGDAIARALATVEHYELPALTRVVTVSVCGDDARALDGLRARHPTLADFRPAAAGAYELTVEVELHRALFLYRDGTLPPLAPRMLAAHPLFPRYARLSLPAQAVYLAAKFGLDTEAAPGARPQPQSLKLLGDVVRLVEAATAGELEESVAIARTWRCERLFAATLATAAPLLPEVEFAGLWAPPYDVGALAALATAPAGPGVPA